MTTSIFLNDKNEPATIEIKTGHPVDHQFHTISKTWEELTQGDKQNIARDWIKDHVYCNVNQVMELLAQNDDHIDYDEYMNISECKDYEYASSDHINDLSIDELIDLAEELDINHIDLFRTKYLSDLIENTSNANFSIETCYHELEVTFLQSLDKSENEYTQVDIENELINFFKSCFDFNTNDYFNFDDLETCIINLNINFDGYLKAYRSDLASLVIASIDLNEYGSDNDLEPEYEQAYEFYSVSDHFIVMLQNELSCSNDILGLSVWARYCTGQSICLDIAIQKAAFKALSDTSYKNY